MSAGNELIDMYEKMIEKLNFRLNPLKYALITISCSRQYESKYFSFFEYLIYFSLYIDIEDSIQFLERAKERLKDQDALFLLEIA